LEASASLVPFGPPASVRRSLRRALAGAAIRDYPDREHQALRQAIAQRHGLEAAMVLPGNGAAELFTWVGRDAARAAGCTLARGAKGAQAAPGAAPAGRPFFVAAAECPGDSAARTAGLVRALPGAQQLPATGLVDVVSSLGLHLTRDGGRGILLAGRPHVAVALANRSPGVRAVTARDTTTLLAAAQECAANLLVIVPRDFSASSLERIGVTLAGRDPRDGRQSRGETATACGGRTMHPRISGRRPKRRATVQ
jgi:hypothetical protein